MELEEDSVTRVVKLVSAEGHEFYVGKHSFYRWRNTLIHSPTLLEKRCAMVSGTISKILSSQFAESSGEIKFPQIQGIVLEKVIQYLYHKVRHTNSARNPPNFVIEPGIEFTCTLTCSPNLLMSE